jgi:class 3 adenylate cyclase/tetratricopeptide (TPR) repeat protein
MTLPGNGRERPRQPTERRYLIVMFCDVVDSTRMSRQRDVESYFSVLSAYYDACQSVVAQHGGFVAQHHGDGIYIWFGYPHPEEDDALRAVRAGADLLVVLSRVSAELESEVGERLTVRIAAHAGEVLVASVENESGPLAFGHTPNFAAKLQLAARPSTMIISKALHRMVERDVEVMPRPQFALPTGVPSAYEVISTHRNAGRIVAGWRTPLVGREAELEQLERVWMAVRDGPGRTLAIVGDRGIGKTRLASVVATKAVEHGATVLDCTCSRVDAGTAYRIMRVLLAAAAGIDRDDPPVASITRLHDHLVGALGMEEQASAVLGTILGLAEDGIWSPPSLDPIRLAQLTVRSLVEWLRRLAAGTPTIVAVDDVAEADPSSLEILTLLAADPPPRLLVVVTAHSVPALPTAFAGAGTEIVELGALSEPDAEILVSEVTAASPVEPQVSEQILRQGEGVPLFLEELARTAQEVNDVALPIALAGRFHARLASAGVDREVAGVLAVAGHDVEEAILTAVLRVDARGLQDRIVGLTSRDLVVHLNHSRSRYRFRHGLIADAAYGLLLNDDRIRLHGRVADAMIAWQRLGHRVDWFVVGHHLDLANRPDEAIEAILTGAGEAGSSGPTHEAMQGYRNALDLLERVTDVGVRDRLEIRCRLQRGAAAIAARGWGAAEAIEDFTRCAELCRQLGPRSEHLAVMTGVYSYFLVQGKLDAARLVAEELRDWVDAGHEDYRADNGLGFGTLCFYEGDYAGALDHLRRAAQLFDQQKLDEQHDRRWLMPFDAMVITLSHLAKVLWITGSPTEADDIVDRAMARAAGLPFPEGPFSMAYVKSWLAWTHNVGGRHLTAARFAADVLEIGERHGFVFWESAGTIHLAIAEHGANRRPDAADVIATQVALWEFLRSRVLLPYVLTAAAQMRAELGQHELAAVGYESAGQLAEETGSRFYEAERLRLLAGTDLVPRAQARQLLDQARELANRQGALLFELRAALDSARLDPTATAVEVLADVAARFATGAGYPELDEARVLLARSVSPA